MPIPLGVRVMAGKDAWRNVRFGQPEEDAVGRRGFCGRMGAGIKKLFCGARGKKPAVEMVFAEPEAATNPVSNGAISFLNSLPNNGVRAEAWEAVRRAHGERMPPLVEVKETVVCDRGKGDWDIHRRRDILFAICFGRRNPHMDKEGLLGSHESVNVLYFRVDLFSRMMDALMKRGEEEGLRSKGEDRLGVLRAVEGMLNAMPPKDRMEAFGRIVEIAEKMVETLCTKEACARLVKFMANLEGAEGSVLAALNEMHGMVMKAGVRPSGKEMHSGIPRAEYRKANGWIAGRPQGAMEAAGTVWAKKKPRSYEEFMRMLEECEEDMENKRLHVLEEAVGEWCVGACRGYEPAEAGGMRVAAWNVGYFCISEIKFVASFAEGMEGEERIRLEALDTILWVARRMPPGRRMEAPGMIARAVEKLASPDEGIGIRAKPKQWIITAWMEELRSYMNEPRAEVAFSKLSWLANDPMKVLM